MRETLCETGHNLIRSRIKIVTLRNKHRKVWCRKKDCVPTRLDARMSDDEETKKTFSSRLSSSLKELKSKSLSCVCATIKKIGNAILGKHRDWIEEYNAQMCALVEECVH